MYSVLFCKCAVFALPDIAVFLLSSMFCHQEHEAPTRVGDSTTKARDFPAKLGWSWMRRFKFEALWPGGTAAAARSSLPPQSLTPTLTPPQEEEEKDEEVLVVGVVVVVVVVVLVVVVVVVVEATTALTMIVMVITCLMIR